MITISVYNTLILLVCVIVYVGVCVCVFVCLCIRDAETCFKNC